MSDPTPAPPSLSRVASPPAQEAPKESAIARLVIAPVTFISFLISLALIDNHNSSLRTHYHSATHPPPAATLYGRFKHMMHSWIYRPEPYSYVKSPNTQQKGRDGLDAKAGKDEPWHWNTKQRKMMKLEFTDAFEMRKRVVVILASVLLGAGAVTVWAIQSTIGYVRSALAKP